MNEIILADCMDIMKDMPDRSIDLAIVDPPYGIEDWNKRGSNKEYVAGKESDKLKQWDKKPDSIYFQELFRVSCNQIIWGANHFLEYLPNTKSMIIWDKKNVGMHFNNFELAWTKNIKEANRIFRMSSSEHRDKKIHPTQKPVQLYQWLLQDYAKEGQLILDTHSGSGSLACACHLEKFDFIAIEKDVDYHRDSVKRLDELRSQGVLF